MTSALLLIDNTKIATITFSRCEFVIYFSIFVYVYPF